jgi:hypothetical protein
MGPRPRGGTIPEQTFGVNAAARIARMTQETGVRFRCGACGNLTRFDVVEARRTRSYYHYTVGGDLNVEEEEVLGAQFERVTCRWCGSSDQIEELPVGQGRETEEAD